MCIRDRGIVAGIIGVIGASAGLRALTGIGGTVAGAVGATGTASALSRLSPTASGVARFGAIGLLASLYNATPDDIEDLTGFRPPDFLFTPIADFFPDLPNFDNVGAIATSGRAPSSSQVNLPPIRVDLNLDGQLIDQRIINVNERSNRQAIDDLTSSIGG